MRANKQRQKKAEYRTRSKAAAVPAKKSKRRGAVAKSSIAERKNRVKQLFMVLVIWIAVIGFGMLGFDNAKQVFELDIQSVQIDGNFKNVDQNSIKQLVLPHLQDGFFTLNLAPIKRELEQQQWVYRAQVRRRWPSGIRVSIVEQTPIAIWNGSSLLNADGEAFVDDAAMAAGLNLPQLSGLAGQQIMLMQRYQEFSRLLRPTQQTIAALTHTDRDGIKARLHDGPEIRFGSNHLLEKMKKFLSLHERLLVQRPGELAYIDFRYQSGAALRWRDGNTGVAAQEFVHQEKLI